LDSGLRRLVTGMLRCAQSVFGRSRRVP
jgi:hypothetical protein